MISDSTTLSAALEAALALPRQAQPEALRQVSARIEVGALEEWNSRFGVDSLFDAWTSNHLLHGLYSANAACLRQCLSADWTAIEVGGGDGRLWSHLSNIQPGNLWVVDPNPGVHERLRSVLPSQIQLHSVVAPIESVLPDLPPAHAVICSLTLHHVAGADAEERRAAGLPGPGKLEILNALRETIVQNDGVILINEADIHCDLEIESGSALLKERLIDSYVRRTARALCREIYALEQNGDPEERRIRLLALIKHWCLDQIDMADQPVADRDVYELDVARWMALFKRADLFIHEHHFTDQWLLFHRYELRATPLSRRA